MPSTPRVRSAASLSRRAVGGGQQVERADRVEPPAALGGEVGDDRLDDRQQRGELGGRAVEVVGRQQPQGDHLDADVLAPPEQRQDVVGAGLVALLGVGAVGPGPAPVAVEHHADVAREAAGREAGGEPSLVGAVQQVPQPHRTASSAREIATTVLPGRCARRPDAPRAHRPPGAYAARHDPATVAVRRPARAALPGRRRTSRCCWSSRRRVFARRRFHRQKAHLVLSAMRHRAAELGDRCTLPSRPAPTREALAGVDGPLDVVPADHAGRHCAWSRSCEERDVAGAARPRLRHQPGRLRRAGRRAARGAGC